MKKILCLVSLLAFVQVVKAQTSAGSILLGGGFSFSSANNETPADDLKSSYFSIEPNIGYFLSDNLALGLGVGFSSQKFTNEDKQNNINVSPFVRYYKFIVEDKFAFYAQGTVSFGSGKYDPNAGNETKTSSLSVAVSPGFAYFFNEKWSLDFQFSGISVLSEDPDKDQNNDKRTRFNLGADSFNPSLGFRYFFTK